MFSIPSVPFTYGFSALDLINDLVASGADVNSRDIHDRTPLHYMINTSSGGYEVLTEMEEVLILNGADLFAVDSDGKMPLFYSFSKLGKLVPCFSSKSLLSTSYFLFLLS